MNDSPLTNSDAPENAPANGDAAREEELTAAIARLGRELEAANGRALRAQADLENFRKRARRELEEELRFAALPLVLDLLPVADNIQRALAAGQNNEPHGLREGVRMVAEQVEHVLARHNCKKIPAAGAVFDPHLHQAIGQQPSDETPAGHVLLVALEGYQMHDRVVRPAQVIVSTGPAKS